ncbi:LysE family translocator [Alteromonas aestuariivivens]|uniref:LysE family translocator n=1 Tax=Alteromonas aestuariivivens TaxID=1938339 RepID=A0A3D8M2W3_9ALTE|nr:LysE family translocator [Alteromonas aestuariivivens]RDV24067.1 LysE family translocator [Alteromonas aestuariivivens]
MLPLDVLLTFASAALMLSLSPGPSNLYIMACTMGNGGGAGVAAASGMALGSLIYVLLSAVGLAALIVYSPALFLALKLLGASYLILLGVRTLLTAQQPQLKAVGHLPAKKVLRQSVIVELTNPKTALFFLAFLPQFSQPEQGDVAFQLVLLGVIYSVIALGSDLLVVSLSRQLGGWLVRMPRLAVLQEQLAGVILLSLGTWILAESLLLA